MVIIFYQVQIPLGGVQLVVDLSRRETFNVLQSKTHLSFLSPTFFGSIFFWLIEMTFGFMSKRLIIF